MRTAEAGRRWTCEMWPDRQTYRRTGMLIAICCTPRAGMFTGENRHFFLSTCHGTCQELGYRKSVFRNDLFCVEWEVKPYIYIYRDGLWSRLFNSACVEFAASTGRILQALSRRIRNVFANTTRQCFLPRDALLSAVYAVVVCLCVCVCVRHTPVLYQNG